MRRYSHKQDVQDRKSEGTRGRVNGLMCVFRLLEGEYSRIMVLGALYAWVESSYSKCKIMNTAHNIES